MEPAATSLASAVPAAAEPSGHHLMLDYRAPGADCGGMPPVWWSAMMLGTWSLAATTLFVPFTWGISPWDVAFEFASAVWTVRVDEGMFLILLAVPFLGAFPAAAWHMRLVVWRRRVPGPGERIVALALGLLMAAAPLAFVVAGLSYGDFDGTAEDWLILSSPFFIVAVGVLAAVLIYRRSPQPVDAVLGVLPIGYVANSAMLLIAFRSDRDLGWSLTLVASAVLVPGMMRLAFLAVRAGGNHSAEPTLAPRSAAVRISDR